MDSENKKSYIKDQLENTVKEIIEEINEGTPRWRQPWSKRQVRPIPTNISTNKPYTGVNCFYLWAKSATNCFATFNQWRKMGAFVRKGEKGFKIIIPKINYKNKEKKEQDKEDKDTWIGFSTFTVFSSDQVDNYDLPPSAFQPKKNKEIETFINTLQPKTQEGVEANYNRTKDLITIPIANSFTSQKDYYGTLLHEIIHWTGHSKRLDRQFGEEFGDRTYAFEELVAELASAVLCNLFGLIQKDFSQHASYINSWVKQLNNNPQLFIKSSTMAWNAIRYINDLQPEKLQIKEFQQKLETN